MPPDPEDGSRSRAKIVDLIREYKNNMPNEIDQDSKAELARFKCLINDEQEEIMAYNDIIDYIEDDDSWDGKWKFREILDHEGPLSPHHPRYKGSSHNVRLRWTDASETWEPINIVGKDDPVTLAAYAKEHNLVDTPGWKFLRRYTHRAKHLRRMLNQTRRQSKNNSPRYKFGVQVPRNVKEAHTLEDANGNTLWDDAIKLELGQLNDYSAFKDAGRGRHHHSPPGSGSGGSLCQVHRPGGRPAAAEPQPGSDHPQLGHPRGPHRG